MARIFLAALLGAIAMFIWVYIAYPLLPIGGIGLHKLPNETVVLDALQKNIAENSGIYLFPRLWLEPYPPHKEFAEEMARYPSGILMYNAAGSRGSAISHWWLVEFLNVLMQAVLTVFLLSRTRLTTFRARLTFVLVVGVLAAIATNVGNLNWYGFPWTYTLASMFIQVVGFLCIGLVAAFVLKKQSFGAPSDREFLQGIWRATPGD